MKRKKVLVFIVTFFCLVIGMTNTVYADAPVIFLPILVVVKYYKIILVIVVLVVITICTLLFLVEKRNK